MKEASEAISGLRLGVEDLLNAQTAKLSWSELQRHFARGVVLVVNRDLDLIEVATRMVQDQRTMVKSLLDAGRLVRADLDQARDWENRKPTFWAVVVAPWVLVQEETSHTPPA